MNQDGDSTAYRTYVAGLSGQWPGVTYLHYYLQSDAYQQNLRARVTFLELDLNGRPVDLDLGNCEYEFDDFIRNYNGHGGTYKLILVENPSPLVLATLGGHFRMEAQFWADLLVGPAWFDKGKIYPGPDSSKSGAAFIPFKDEGLIDQLWPLPSSSQSGRYKCIRAVVLRESTAVSLPSHGHELDVRTRDCPPLGASAIPTRNTIGIWTNQQQTPTVQNPWIGTSCSEVQITLADRRLILNLGVVALNTGENNPGLCIFRDFRKEPLLGSPAAPGITNFNISWRPDTAPGGVTAHTQHYLTAYRSLLSAYAYQLCHDLADANFAALADQPEMLFLNLYRLIASCWVAEIENHHMKYSWIEDYWQRANKQDLFPLRPMLLMQPSTKTRC